jgi:hypothetical protein
VEVNETSPASSQIVPSLDGETAVSPVKRRLTSVLFVGLS